MNTTKIGSIVAGVAVAASLIVGALPASAQTLTTAVSGGVVMTATSTTTGGTSTTNILAKIISDGNTAITNRIADLNKLSAAVQAMQNVSPTEKAAIAAQVQTNISGLTTLKAKLDADTDVATARTDAASIFGSFRIYALIVPRGYLLASADRMTTIGQMMTTLGTSLQARIDAEKAAGKDVTTLQAELNDMTAKVSDANSQSAAIQTGTENLVPDNGDKTVAASNKAALVAAQTNAKTGTSDLTAARADITKLLAALQGSVGGSLGTSVGTSTAAAH